MQIIIFGSPGVGKGTQAKILSKNLNIPHISTGDILRDSIKKETDLGLKAKEIVHRGDLVPDDIMGGIVKETLEDEKCKNGFILDGYPRTVEQAKILDVIFNDLGIDLPILIQLEAEDETIIKRLSERRVCKSCGYIENLNKLSNPQFCPNCNSKDSFYKRKDDDEEVIKNRLQVYKETTKPVLDYYDGKAEIIKIDGAKKITDVTTDILAKMKVS